MKINQKGQVSGTFFAIIAVVVVLLILVFSYVGAHNRANSFENDLFKSYEGSKITLSSCTTEIRNISKIPDKYADQLQEVIQAEMEGRYGGQKTDRVAKFIQERASNYSDKALLNVQAAISACELKFANSQKSFVDIRDDYRKALGTFWGGSLMSAAGFPKNNLDQYKIIMDKSSRKQFETGQREDYDIQDKNKKEE